MQRTLDDNLKSKLRASGAEAQMRQKQRQAVLLGKGQRGAANIPIIAVQEGVHDLLPCLAKAREVRPTLLGSLRMQGCKDALPTPVIVCWPEGG